MTEPASDSGNDNPSSKEVKHSGGSRPPARDGTGEAVDQFHAKHKERVRSVFGFIGRNAARGVLMGAGKEIGGEAIKDIKEDIPDHVQRFLDIVGGWM